MTAFSIASASGFGCLSLVALAVGLLARGHSFKGLAVGLSGIFGLATACAWMAYTGSILEARQSAIRPARLQSCPPMADLANQVEKCVADPLKFVAELSALQTKYDFEVAQHRQAEVELDRAKRELEKSDAHDRQLADDLAALRDKYNNEVDRKQTQAKPGSATPELKHPLRDPDSFIETSAYIWQPLPLEQWPYPSLSGRSFLVRLKVLGTRIQFKNRQFSLPTTAVGALQDSAQKLYDEMLAPLVTARRSVRVFARGTADSRQVGSAENVEVRAIDVILRATDGRYEASARSKSVANPLDNTDLPNLRADWVARTIKHIVGGILSPIEVLNNKPSPDDGRTVDLIVNTGL